MFPTEFPWDIESPMMKLAEQINNTYGHFTLILIQNH